MLFVTVIEPTAVVPCVVPEQHQVVPYRPSDHVTSPTQRETDPASTLEQQMKKRPSKITNSISIRPIVSVTGIICTCSFHFKPSLMFSRFFWSLLKLEFLSSENTLTLRFVTVSQNKGATLTMASSTLSILDRFAKFFLCCKEH